LDCYEHLGLHANILLRPEVVGLTLVVLMKSGASVFSRITHMRKLEETITHIFIEAYGLQDELSPDVPEDQITLRNPNRENRLSKLISMPLVA